MRYTVGSVPYLNSKPLVKPLEWSDSGVTVRYEVPSLLPPMLEKGEADAIMVSSIHALRHSGSRVAAGLSIGSQDEVLSVRLFSKVPISEIRTFATDQSSMTSNALAQIVLAELYGIRPIAVPQQPSLKEMLRESDACLMIGDNGMGADAEGLNVLDLGKEWRRLTGSPFVWALWVGNNGLTPDLVSRLQDAMRESRRDWGRVIDCAAVETGFTEDECHHYLTELMDYRLNDEHIRGLEQFGELAVSNGLIDRFQMPEIVQPEPALVS